MDGAFTVPSLVLAVLAEELAKGDGAFQAGLRGMLLDGSLREVSAILSKSLFGEPLVSRHPSRLRCTALLVILTSRSGRSGASGGVRKLKETLPTLVARSPAF